MTSATHNATKEDALIFVMFNLNTGELAEVVSDWDAIRESHPHTEGWSLRYTRTIEPIQPLVVFA